MKEVVGPTVMMLLEAYVHGFLAARNKESFDNRPKEYDTALEIDAWQRGWIAFKESEAKLAREENRRHCWPPQT